MQANDDVPDGMSWDASSGKLEDSTLVDARRLARNGRNHDEVHAKLRAQLRLDEPLAALESDAAYGGSYWATDDALVVQFRGAAPAGLVDRLQALVDVDVRTKSVAYSLGDLIALQAKVEKRLMASGIPADGIVTGIDPKGQRVVAGVQASGSAKRESVRTSVEALEGGDDVDIVFRSGAIARPKVVYGGASTRQDYVHQCTSGFSVVQSGKGGFLTAHHCRNFIDDYKDWYEGNVHEATFEGTHNGDWGHVSWFSTSGYEWDNFYWNNDGDRRDVSSVKTQFTIGDDIAGYGRGNSPGYPTHNGPTGHTGHVAFLHVHVPGTNFYRMACFNWEWAEPGDSGAPIFDQRVAVGILYGALYIDGAGWKDCFTQARYVDDALGVAIKTQ